MRQKRQRRQKMFHVEQLAPWCCPSRQSPVASRQKCSTWNIWHPSAIKRRRALGSGLRQARINSVTSGRKNSSRSPGGALCASVYADFVVEVEQSLVLRSTAIAELIHQFVRNSSQADWPTTND